MFTLPALKDMLAGNGFRIDSVHGTPSHENPGWGFSTIDRALSHVASLASNFVVVATNERTQKTRYAVDTVVSVR